MCTGSKCAWIRSAGNTCAGNNKADIRSARNTSVWNCGAWIRNAGNIKHAQNIHGWGNERVCLKHVCRMENGWIRSGIGTYGKGTYMGGTIVQDVQYKVCLDQEFRHHLCMDEWCMDRVS